MDRRTFLSLAGAGLSVGLAGCVGGSADPAGEYDVGMSARKFDPSGIEIEPGTTVVWKNTSSVAHTVTARSGQIPDEATFFASGGFGSQTEAERAWREKSGGAIYQGQTFEHEFTVPGEYAYYCIPHEAAGMAGVVSVSGDAGES